MSFTTTIVDAEHRPELYAEIEYDEDLIAEAFVEAGRMRIALMDLDGKPMWTGEVAELEQALVQAREELAKFGLLN